MAHETGQDPDLTWTSQDGQDLGGRGRHAILKDMHEQKGSVRESDVPFG